LNPMSATAGLRQPFHIFRNHHPTQTPFAARPSPASTTTRGALLIMASNRTALIPIANGSEEMEAVIVADVLRRAQVHVTIASIEKDKVTVECSRGVHIVADVLIEDCLHEEYDVVVLPGGMPGAEHLRDNKHVAEILSKQRASDKHIAAICAAPQVVLDSQGLLDGRKATAHPAFSDKLPNRESVEQRVVSDGKVMTSRGPGTAFEFALSLVKLLFDEAKAEEIAGPMVMYDGWKNSLV